MLNLVLGRSGSSKTYYVRDKIKKLIESGIDKIILIVPEQNSFENEKAMLKLLGANKLSKLEILSFTRLCEFVNKKLARADKPKLDDAGRAIFMSLAIENLRENLDIYKKSVDNVEFIDVLIKALSEFKMCNITNANLIDIQAKIKDDSLNKKLYETALIINMYESLIDQSFIDPLDDLTRLYNILLENNILEGYYIFLDGFTSFTKQELKLIELIIKSSEEFYISLCTDSFNLSDNGFNLFSAVNKTVKKIVDISRKENIKINKPILLSKQNRFKNNELKFLEDTIFRPSQYTYNDEVSNISIYSASDKYDEIEYIAATIRNLVMNNGYEYSDFAVISRFSNEYLGIIDNIFDKYEIPYFMDKPENIDSKPLMRLVVTALNIIESNFEAEYVLRYLKTGLLSFTTEDISLFENYVFLWSINKGTFLEEFKFNPNGISSRLSDDDILVLQKVNSMRQCIIDPLIRLKEATDDTDGLNISRAIYSFLHDINIDNNLSAIISKQDNFSDLLHVKEQVRVFNILVDILDQMAMILKNKKIKRSRYLNLLRIVITLKDMAFIPKSLDQVIIGDANRIRLENPKITFIIGANEGVFPALPTISGIFSDMERKTLILSGLEIYDPIEKMVIEERFLAYTSMTSPSERLYLSYESNGEKRESEIITNVKKFFTKIKIKSKSDLKLIDKIWAKIPTFELYARHKRENSIEINTIKKYFENDKDFENKLSLLEKIINNDTIKFKDSNNAKEFFKDDMEVTATQIEKYYLCRFAYFCKYGLLAKERKPVDFNPMEYGKVVHYLFERILSNYSKLELLNLDKTEIKNTVLKFLSEYIEDNLLQNEDQNQRFKYLVYRVCDSVTFLVLHMINEFSQSEFSPCDYELTIGDNCDIPSLVLKVSDSENIRIKGQVDRVDILKKGNKSYIRIIDYKTGSKTFKLSDILYGLNMQMLIYLSAIYRNGKDRYNDVVPCGVLYMPSDRPIIVTNKDIDDKKLSLQISKKLRMNGVIVNDEDIIRSMEKDLNGTYIPVSKKDLESNKSESIVSYSEISSILQYVENKVILMAKGLRSGDISPNPVCLGYDSCEYCPYFSVCCYSEQDKTPIEKWDKDAVIASLKKENTDKNDE